jgi:hypothetical protein
MLWSELVVYICGCFLVEADQTGIHRRTQEMGALGEAVMQLKSAKIQSLFILKYCTIFTQNNLDVTNLINYSALMPCIY